MRNPLSRAACLNAAHLKILAMALMLCDHAWATIASNCHFLTMIGRLAFPIFAFQLAEGYAHTRNFKTYWKRMFLFALITEIPFNFMTGGVLFYPLHQNVMFSFCLALWILRRVDLSLQKGGVKGIAFAVLYAILGYILGIILFVDYYGFGVWMVLLFWLTRDKSWGWIGQLAGMIYINGFMIKGLGFEVELFGQLIFITEQSLAVLALIPIWLYNGQRGWNNKAFQYACYAFYPAHIAVLAALGFLM